MQVSIYIFKSFIYNSDKENLCVKIHIKDICIKWSIVLCMHEYMYMSIIYIRSVMYKYIYMEQLFHAFTYIYIYI